MSQNRTHTQCEVDEIVCRHISPLFSSALAELFFKNFISKQVVCFLSSDQHETAKHFHKLSNFDKLRVVQSIF